MSEVFRSRPISAGPTLLVGLAVCFTGACGGGGKQSTGAGGTGGQSIPADTCPPTKDDQGHVINWDCGPSSDDLFSNAKLAEVHMTFDPADIATAVQELRRKGHEEKLDTWLDIIWAKWQHCGPYNNYLPVTVEYRSPDGIGNSVLQKAGIRLRGTKSRGSNALQGFKIDFQALLPEPPDGEKSRRLGGENKLSLLSVEGDTSLSLQCLAYEIMRSYGDVPSPRCNHLKIYANGEYYGILQNVEEVDDSRFRKHFFSSSKDNGTLYSCSGGCGYDDSKADLEYYGDEFVEFEGTGSLPANQYPKAYEAVHLAPDDGADGGAPDAGAEQLAKKAIESNLIPMLKCGDKDSTPDDQAFKTCIEEWIDVDEWLKVIAAESLMPTVESFIGAKRNFYLYFKPQKDAPHGGRFLVYSWDYDAAMVRAGCNPSSCDPLTSVATWYTGGGRPPLVIRLTTLFRERYCAAMNSFLTDAYKPELVDGFAKVLDPAMLDAPVPFADGRDSQGQVIKRDPLTHDVWQTKILAVRDYITTHRTVAHNQVNAICYPTTADGGTP